MRLPTRPWRALALAALALAVLPAGAAAEDGGYLLAVPPALEGHEPPAGAYRALAEFLSVALAVPVRLEQPPNALAYQNGLIADRYDFLLDQAHIVGWRLATAGHEVIVGLRGEQRYAVLAPAQGVVRTLAQAAGRRSCIAASPSLPSMLLLAQFPNPLRQPLLQEMHTSTAVHGALIDGGCEIGVMRLVDYERAEARVPSTLTVLARFPALPPPALTAGQRVSDLHREQARMALFSPPGRAVLAPFLEAYGADDLTAVDPRHYLAYAALLSRERGFGEALESAASPRLSRRADPSGRPTAAAGKARRGAGHGA